MSFESALSRVERAVAELRKAQSESGAWDDDRRRDLDGNRIQPLLDAAVRLKTSLQKAQETARRIEQSTK